MVTGPLSEAHVEVGADTSTADRNLDQLDDRLEQVERVAREVGESIEDVFKEAFRAILGDVDQSLNEVEREFNETQREVDGILRDIGGPELFATIEAQAEAAGESVEGAFAEAKRGADEDLADIGGAGAFTPVVVGAEVAAESVERSFRDASDTSIRAMTRIGTSGAGFSLLTTGLAGFVAALGVAGAATVGFGLKGAAALEQTTIGFTALLGSAEEADAFIKEMQQFAAETPFEFQGLAENARRLLAIGDAAGISREEIIPTIGVFGDLSSVLGAAPDSMDRVVRALGQIASRGKVSTEEMLQLAEALPGFSPFQAMADGLGLTTAELQEQISAGLIPAQEGIDALIGGMRDFPGAAGAMAAQAQTLTGVFSTFKDTVQIALTDAFQPLVPEIKATLVEATDVVGDALGTLAPALSSVASSLLGGVLDIFAGLAPGLASLFSGLGEGLAILGPTLSFVAGQLSVAFAPLETVLPQIALLLQPILSTLAQLAAAILPPLITVIGAVAEAFTPLLQVIGEVFQQLAGAFGPVLDLIADQLSSVGSLLADVFTSLFDSGVITTLADTFTTLADAIAPVIEDIGGALLSAIAAVLPVAAELVELLAGTFADILTSVIVPILPALSEAFNGIAQALVILLPPLLELVGTLVSALAPILVELGGLIGTVIADALGLFAELVVTLAEAFAPLLPVVGDLVSALGDALLQVLDELAPVIPELTEAFGAIAVALAEILVALVPLIVPLVQLTTLLVTELGAPVLVAIAQAFAVVAIAIAEVVEAVGNLAGFIADNAGPALMWLWQDVLVPTGEFLAGVFTGAIQGAADLFTNVLVPATTAVIDAATWLWQSVLVPFLDFVMAVLQPVLIALAVVAFGPLAVAVTAVSIAANALWNFVLYPFSQFLLAVFTPIVSALGTLLSVVLSAAFTAVSTVAGFLWNSVLVPLGGFLAAGFTGAINLAKGAWDLFSGAVSSVAGVITGAITTAFNPIKSLLETGLTTAIGVATSAWGLMQGAIDFVSDAIDTLIGWIETAIDKAGDLADKISSIPGAGLVGDAAGLFGLGATGGIFDQPTPMIIGEAGREVLLPLTDPDRALELASQSGLFGVLSRALGAGNAAPLSAGVSSGNVGGATIINITAHVAGNMTPEQGRRVGREIGAGAAEVLDRRAVRVEAKIA